MILYVADNQKLEKYKLPNKIEESFLFKYSPNTGNNEYFFNIFAKNSNWYLKTNDSMTVKIDNNSPLIKNQDIQLSSNVQFNVIISGCNSNPLIFCKDDNLLSSQIYKVDFSPITIGSSEDCIIKLKNGLTLPNHANLIYQNERWYITANPDLNCYVYLNNIRVTTSVLNRGDIIFIDGLRIIWMQEFIKICDVNDNIKVSKLSFVGNNIEQNNNIGVNSNEDDNIQLYRESDYFYHRPRLKTVIDEKVVTIDPPPKNEQKEELPFWLSFGSRVTMLAFTGVMLLNAYNSYQKTKEISSVIPMLITSIAMLIGSLVFPIIIKLYQKRISNRREQLRQEKYGKYLKEKEKEISLLIQEQKQILLENSPNVNECYDIALKHRTKLWTREISDDDFLTVRVGLGTLPVQFKIDAPKKRFELYDDNLFEEVYKIVNNSQKLVNVPITTSLVRNSISSIICDASFKDEYVKGILLQLMVHQSSNDLKIAVFTSKRNMKKWDYLKNAPHCWSNDRTTRYFATNLEEMKEISMELEKEYVGRIESAQKDKEKEDNEKSQVYDKKPAYKKFAHYYLIVIDNYKDAKTIQLINDLMQENSNYGYSLLLITGSIQELPNMCSNFIYVMDKSGCILNKEISTESQLEFIPEYNPTIDIDKVTFTLSNIPIEVNNGLEELPTSISFLEMYNVGRMEQLNILNKWQTNSPINTLAAPVGVHANGDLFKLDLHEKNHGPHGLVAGSTGSGKSEFIITYILSMAVNYHPDYVQFVLIDYKGGGLAGAFENRETGVCIPHLAGTITNLDSSEINRTLVSIESELKRRQAKFNEVRDRLGESTIDIYKYQKFYREGLIDEPIPHLFIISDEFAELKSQQPEFMTQLISTARIGRSLGVHLILATQKPSGVVNDQIWSNSKFKVCLRVQTKADSMEMLKRDEAANIKEAGRFYLQVGYNELFEQGQSAWCGAKYIPSDKVKKKLDNSVEFVDNIGNSIKKIEDIIKQEVEEEQGEQLTNIVRYLIELAKKENIISKKLWLPPLDDEILIMNLIEKYNFTSQAFNLETIIGEYDSPKNQSQGLATINFTTTGNLLIYGETGSGKDNLIYTIISSLITMHSPEEVNFYLVDYSSETMKRFDKLPHVGDVVYSEDTEKLVNLLVYIDEEITRRKKLFENYMGNYISYCNESGATLPQIIVVLAGYDVLIEQQPKIFDKLVSIFRDCSKYGIYFVLSVTMSNSVRYRVAQLFPNKICLQLQDNTDYRTLINAPRNVFPAKKFGRGLIEINESIYEFQTAMLCQQEVFNKTIDEYSKKLSEVYTYEAPKIKVLPKNLLISSIIKDNPLTALEEVPIGLKKSTLSILNYNFMNTPILPVITNFLDEEFGFIAGLIEAMRTIPNTKVRVLDFLGICQKTFEDVPVYQDDFDTVIRQVDIELDKDTTTNRTTVFIFVGIGNIKNKISKEYHPFIDKIFTRIKDMKKNRFIISDNYISYRNIESDSWYNKNIDKTTGIWLGDGIANQMSIKTTNIDLNSRRLVFKDMAYLIQQGKVVLFKHIIDKERKKDE